MVKFKTLYVLIGHFSTDTVCRHFLVKISFKEVLDNMVF